MSIDISRLAFALSAASQRFPTPLKSGHAQQLLAAVLGYRSLAAFQASPEESSWVNDVRHLILDHQGLERRIAELKLPHPPSALMAEIVKAFSLRMPEIALYANEDRLVDGVRTFVEQRLLDRASDELAMTNGKGLDEIYLPVDDFTLADLPLPDESAEFEVDGHISVEPDDERPYSGHKVLVQATLGLKKVTRNGIAEPEITTQRIKLDWSWGDEDDHPRRPMAEMLAELLKIEIDEAAELVDVEPQELSSNDDLVYGYVLDFEEIASPTLRAKILSNNGTLQVRVGPEFFDLVQRDFDD